LKSVHWVQGSRRENQAANMQKQPMREDDTEQ